MTGFSKETQVTQVTQVTQKTSKVILDQVRCIHYPVQFRKNKKATIQALINSGNEVNAMAPAYAAKLGLKVCPPNVGAQKIDSSLLRTFGMVIAGFQIEDKLSRIRFFQESILLAEISIEVVLGMFFFTLSNADIKFVEKELIWRFYTAVEALPTTKRVELINKKEFAKPALDEESKTFVVYIATLEESTSSARMTMHPS